MQWGDYADAPAGSPADGSLPSGDVGGDVDCFSTDGIGIDPVTWIPGALHDGECILEYLFVPDSAPLSALASPFLDHVPFMWLANAGRRSIRSGRGLPRGSLTVPVMRPGSSCPVIRFCILAAVRSVSSCPLLVPTPLRGAGGLYR